MDSPHAKSFKPRRRRASGPEPCPRPLRHRLLWQALGWTMVAVVVWLSLTPHPPKFRSVPLLSWDKAQHALAYACLMFWYGQAFRRHWRWPAFLLALGMGLEILQGLGGVRSFDLRDMLANGIGVGIGLILTRTRLGGILAKIDHGLAALRGATSR